KILFYMLTGGRIGIASLAPGIASVAYATAFDYAQQRKQFGAFIYKFQQVNAMLEEMRFNVAASGALIGYASYLKDHSADTPQDRNALLTAASMSKLFASEKGKEVTRLALQVYAGYGYTNEYPLERYVRDIFVTTIYEGTSQIQTLLIQRPENIGSLLAPQEKIDTERLIDAYLAQDMPINRFTGAKALVCKTIEEARELICEVIKTNQITPKVVEAAILLVVARLLLFRAMFFSHEGVPIEIIKENMLNAQEAGRRLREFIILHPHQQIIEKGYQFRELEDKSRDETTQMVIDYSQPSTAPLFIAISGASEAGKSTYADELASALAQHEGKVEVLHGDKFIGEAERTGKKSDEDIAWLVYEEVMRARGEGKNVFIYEQTNGRIVAETIALQISYDGFSLLDIDMYASQRFHLRALWTCQSPKPGGSAPGSSTLTSLLIILTTGLFSFIGGCAPVQEGVMRGDGSYVLTLAVIALIMSGGIIIGASSRDITKLRGVRGKAVKASGNTSAKRRIAAVFPRLRLVMVRQSDRTYQPEGSVLDSATPPSPKQPRQIPFAGMRNIFLHSILFLGLYILGGCAPVQQNLDWMKGIGGIFTVAILVLVGIFLFKIGKGFYWPERRLRRKIERYYSKCKVRGALIQERKWLQPAIEEAIDFLNKCRAKSNQPRAPAHIDFIDTNKVTFAVAYLDGTLYIERSVLNHPAYDLPRVFVRKLNGRPCLLGIITELRFLFYQLRNHNQTEEKWRARIREKLNLIQNYPAPLTNKGKKAVDKITRYLQQRFVVISRLRKYFAVLRQPPSDWFESYFAGMDKEGIMSHARDLRKSIQIDLTNFCPIQCRYCLRPCPATGKFMPWPWVAEVINVLWEYSIECGESERDYYLLPWEGILMHDPLRDYRDPLYEKDYGDVAELWNSTTHRMGRIDYVSTSGWEIGSSAEEALEKMVFKAYRPTVCFHITTESAWFERLGRPEYIRHMRAAIQFARKLFCPVCFVYGSTIGYDDDLIKQITEAENIADDTVYKFVPQRAGLARSLPEDRTVPFKADRSAIIFGAERRIFLFHEYSVDGEGRIRRKPLLQRSGRGLATRRSRARYASPIALALLIGMALTPSSMASELSPGIIAQGYSLGAFSTVKAVIACCFYLVVVAGLCLLAMIMLSRSEAEERYDQIKTFHLATDLQEHPEVRQKIIEALAQADFNPAQLIDALKEIPEIRQLYAASAGVREGYTVEEHTLRVMELFEEYFAQDRLLRLTFALHDIGKSLAIKNGEREKHAQYTERVIREITPMLPVSGAELQLIIALIKNEAIDRYLNKGLKVREAVRLIGEGAKEASLPLVDFFRLLTIYFQVDAGAYAMEPGSLAYLFAVDRQAGDFVFNEAKGRLTFSRGDEERFCVLEEMVNKQSPSFSNVLSLMLTIGTSLLALIGGCAPAQNVPVMEESGDIFGPAWLFIALAIFTFCTICKTVSTSLKRLSTVPDSRASRWQLVRWAVILLRQEEPTVFTDMLSWYSQQHIRSDATPLDKRLRVLHFLTDGDLLQRQVTRVASNPDVALPADTIFALGYLHFLQVLPQFPALAARIKSLQVKRRQLHDFDLSGISNKQEYCEKILWAIYDLGQRDPQAMEMLIRTYPAIFASIAAERDTYLIESQNILRAAKDGKPLCRIIADPYNRTRRIQVYRTLEQAVRFPEVHASLARYRDIQNLRQQWSGSERNEVSNDGIREVLCSMPEALFLRIKQEYILLPRIFQPDRGRKEELVSEELRVLDYVRSGGEVTDQSAMRAQGFNRHRVKTALQFAVSHPVVLLALNAWVEIKRLSVIDAPQDNIAEICKRLSMREELAKSLRYFAQALPANIPHSPVHVAEKSKGRFNAQDIRDILRQCAISFTEVDMVPACEADLCEAVEALGKRNSLLTMLADIRVIVSYVHLLLVGDQQWYFTHVRAQLQGRKAMHLLGFLREEFVRSRNAAAISNLSRFNGDVTHLAGGFSCASLSLFILGMGDFSNQIHSGTTAVTPEQSPSVTGFLLIGLAVALALFFAFGLVFRMTSGLGRHFPVSLPALKRKAKHYLDIWAAFFRKIHSLNIKPLAEEGERHLAHVYTQHQYVDDTVEPGAGRYSDNGLTVYDMTQGVGLVIFEPGDNEIIGMAFAELCCNCTEIGFIGKRGEQQVIGATHYYEPEKYRYDDLIGYFDMLRQQKNIAVEGVVVGFQDSTDQHAAISNL
ncbi:MAG: acyl-CoA dehydrogenase family protein, partial [Candidatus Omnitrophica bacterium]|nr:acyl-CoA dehydrogenase family protein [Candidatus Omnitrophota bacterium]